MAATDEAIELAARLRAIAPRTAGASAKPRSRIMPLAPLAIPITCRGTVLTVTAATELTDSAKPAPPMISGTISGATDTSLMDTAVSQRSPMAVRARPTPSTKRGLTTASAFWITG